MNKKLSIINTILFVLIAIILFSHYFTSHWAVLRFVICSIIILILLIIHLIQFKNKNEILENKKYNLMFLLTNIIVLVIIMRDKFDYMLPLQDDTIYENIVGVKQTISLYLDYNMLFIIVMYSGILIYNLINKTKKDK